MNIDSLTIGQLKEITQLIKGSSNESCLAKQFIGKVVLVRTYSAGVHYGTLEEVAGTETILINARRIWSWQGAFTLSEISQAGIKDGKLSDIVPKIYLSQSIEIIPCSNTAINKLNKIEAYVP